MRQTKRCFLLRGGTVFTLLFAVSMAMHTVLNVANSGWYDANLYWDLGKSCGWNVRNIEWEFRGWVLPYIFSMCYQFGIRVGSEYLGYRILSSFCFAFTFTFSFAYVVKILEFDMSDVKTAYAGGVCGILFLIFFRGLIIYTLSDFYAFSLALLSIILLYRILHYDQKIYRKIFESFLLGLCLYATYNIRTIYQFLLIACVCVIVFWQLFQHKWQQLLMTTPTCFVGIFVCSIPQYIVNYNLQKVYSGRVLTGNLILSQFSWGIMAERYATYVGEASEYGMPGMWFTNSIGRAILDRAQVTEFTSFTQLIQLMLRNPLDFIGIYVRHFLNMFYPIYPEQYIENIHRDKSLLLVLFYTILFIAVFYFIKSFKLKDTKWVWFALIVLPCVCILPGAVEIRFFIALHFLIYIYAVAGVSELIKKFKIHKVQYIVTYLTGFLLYIAYVGLLLGTTKEGIATIHF